MTTITNPAIRLRTGLLDSHSTLRHFCTEARPLLILHHLNLSKCKNVDMRFTRTFSAVALLASAALLLSACVQTRPNEVRVAVMVSGVGSVSPYTTPTEGCATGLSAGTTDSYVRDYLLEKGIDVYTAPVMTGPSEVAPNATEEEGGPYGDCPEQPSADLTVDSIGSVTTGGENLAAFVNHLHDEFGVTQVDLIAHSLGGIFTRNAIKNLQDSKSPVTVTSLTTLGSPWEPVMLASPPYDPQGACDGSELCEQIVTGLMSIESVHQIVDFFQPESFDAWTAEQEGVLDEIPVTLVAGTYFTKTNGRADKWPNDGYVQFSAATARSVPDSILPMRSCFVEPFTHSPFTSALVGDVAERAITWNDQTGEIVANAIRAAGTDKQLPNRLGCPTPE